MRWRFKSVLTFIFILIVACVASGIGYLFYNEIKDDADIVVDGALTINYLNGKSFKLNGDAEVNFSVTNNNKEQKYYYIQLTDVYAKDVTYELSSSDNLKINNNLKSDIISNQVVIGGNETVNYTLKFSSNQGETYSGTIQIGTKKMEENTFAEVILSNNKESNKTLSAIGEAATLDEGLLTSQDDQGIAYYFRGAVKNNNVVFADKKWKIVKINGDGSVKLVLDGITESISSFYSEDYEFEKSTVHDYLNEWFESNLNDYVDYIAYHKYCNDLVLETDKSTYVAYNRIEINRIPTFVCLGTAINGKIGLLTADEVILAGGSKKDNKDFYLYNKDIGTAYFTMTSASMSSSTYSPYIVTINGALSSVSGKLLRGVRPTINISKNARVTGTGTLEDPYQIIKS